MQAQQATAQFPQKIFSLDSAPDWIAARELDKRIPGQHDSASTCLLLDNQTLFSESGRLQYSRICTRINDETCVENLSQSLYDLNPLYETLVIHSINIHRESAVIDALDEENIRTFQREQQIENQIASDDITIEVITGGLRVGDILDIEVTRETANLDHPVIGKYLFETHRLFWSCQVIRKNIRLINQSSQSIVIRHLDSANNVETTERVAPAQTFEKCFDDLQVKESTSMLPDDYWPAYLFATSDFSWEEIGLTLVRHYKSVMSKEGKLQKADIAANLPELNLQNVSSESVLQVIRFVQNEIRYRSDCEGIFSHTPRVPSKTLKKRAGDCKDKSYLLVEMLRILGVDADVALVNTSLRQGLDSIDPSPLWFDHMIVTFQWQGKQHWIDATAKKQGGNLSNMSCLNYRRALVLNQFKPALVEVPLNHDSLVFEMQQEFDLTDVSAQGALVEIVRKYHGERADSLRYYFASNERSLVEERYLKYSSECLNNKLTTMTPLSIESDDLESNILQTRETYKLELPGKEDEDNSFIVDTVVNADLIQMSDDGYPMKLDFDGICEQTIRIRYSAKPMINSDEKKIETQWFSYEDSVKLSDTEAVFFMRMAPKDPLLAISDREEYNGYLKELQNRSLNRFPALTESTSTMASFLWGGTFLCLLALTYVASDGDLLKVAKTCLYAAVTFGLCKAYSKYS